MKQRVCLALALCVCLAAGPAWTDVAEVAATNANLRSAPGTSSPVVATLVRGARLEVLDVSGDWLKVRVVETKAVGWVHRRLVEMLPATGGTAPASAAPKPTALVAVAAPAAGAPVSIEHRDVGCIVAGHYPKLEACFSPDASVGRGRVLFRAVGSDPWYYVDMSRDGSCYSAVLPKPKPELKGFEYFVDVIDKAFVEAHKPEGAPERAFAPRVVKKQDDCDPARKMALFLPRLVNPIVVGIARNPAGGVLSAVAAKALESHALLTGFSSEGVIVSSTGAAPAAASGSSTSSGTSATAHAGGGLPKIAIVGGVVAAGALVAVAAGGGGGGSSSGSGAGGFGSGGSGAGGSGGGGGSSLAGQWAGNSAGGNGLTFQFGSDGLSCTSKYDIAANLTQSGNAVGGNMTYSGHTFTCTASDPQLQQILDNALIPGDSGGFPLNGTATDTNVTLIISTITFTGTHSRTTMDLNGNLGASLGLPYTMTLKLVRQ
jgi:uncharacterized protein YraI